LEHDAIVAQHFDSLDISHEQDAQQRCDILPLFDFAVAQPARNSAAKITAAKETLFTNNDTFIRPS